MTHRTANNFVVRDASLHERDFYAWANQQAGLLREGRLSEADIEHVAEEIESLGKAEKRELVSRLTVLLLHLLKWLFQPGRRDNGWRNTVRVQRIALRTHLTDNPSLKSVLADAIADAYRIARIEADTETGLSESSFPAICPWSFDQMMEDDFWPEEPAQIG